MAGWPRLGRQGPGEESPGSTETRCRVTPGGGDPRDSATENRPPRAFGRGARVKRCGKSAPRNRQRKRHGKPHREQDQIGMAHGPFPGCRPGWSREPVSNDGSRGMVIPWQQGQNPAYRPSGIFSRTTLRAWPEGVTYVASLFALRLICNRLKGLIIFLILR